MDPRAWRAVPRGRLRQASALLAPDGALRRALEDDCWAPHGVANDWRCTRTRTVMVLIFADSSATDEGRYQAQRWVDAQPASHRTAALCALAEAL